MINKSDVFIYFKNKRAIPYSDKDTFVAILPHKICNVSKLFEVLFIILLLPEYFGFNWNALSDCLRDLSWLTEKNVILAHEELPLIPQNDLFEYLNILYECVTDWNNDETHKLIVMFPEDYIEQIKEILMEN